MSFDAGSAVGKYILDITDAERKAAELRSLFAGIRQDAAQATGVAAPTGGNASAINQTTAAIKQQTSASLELAGVRSREALATGNVSQALAIYDGAMGSAATKTNQSAEASLRFVQAEARALQQVGQYRQAIDLLEGSLEKFNTRTVTVINAERQLTAIEDQAIAVQQREADGLIRLAQAQARAQVATGNRAAALRTLGEVETAGASERVVAGLDTQIASLTRATDASQQFGQAVRSNLLSIVGPAAAAGAAFQVLRSAVDATEEGFRLRAALDAEQRAAAVQLAGLRDTSVMFERANAFAARYRLTQEETSEAISDSVPVIRRSRSSIEDILSVFTRLTILKPGKTFNDAARAIGELQSGQLGSLERIFNVSATDAQRMKHEIDGGADAIQVLSEFLNRSNIGMKALETRAKGVSGRMLELKQANEDLSLALGDNATGPGAAILDLRIESTKTAAKALKGDLIDINKILGAANPAFLTGGIVAYNAEVLRLLGILPPATEATKQNAQSNELLGLTQEQTAQNTRILAGEQAHLADEHREVGRIVQQTSAQVQEFNSSLQQNAAQSQISAAQSTILKHRQDDIARSALLASQGMLGEGDQALLLAQRLGIARDQAQLLINANQILAGQAAFAAQRAEEQGRLPDDELRSRNRARDAADKLHQQFVSQEAQKQKQLADAQRTLDLARAKTPAQRIAILQRELSQTTDVAERLRIQAQIEGERNSTAKAHTSELTKQLGLEEKIRDSKEAQLKASIDARKLAAQDVLDRLKEDQELAQARRVLANSHDERFRQAAQARIDLIGAERDSRALALQQAQATAGGTIVNGRVFQSIPSAAGQQAPALPSTAGRPGLSAPTTTGGGTGMTVQFVVSGQVIAQAIIPDVIADLRASRDQATSTGGVRP